MKDTEMENLKLKMKNEHLNKVNGLCQTENGCLNKIIIQSSTIIQENYLILRSSGDLDNAMKDKLTSLLKMIQGERNVKFFDENATSEMFELNIGEWKEQNDVGRSPMSAKKRAMEDSNENHDKDAKKSKRAVESHEFLRPKAVKSINFQVPQIELPPSHDLNVTFDAGPKPSPSTSTKVLSDKMNKISVNSKCKSRHFPCRTDILIR